MNTPLHRHLLALAPLDGAAARALLAPQCAACAPPIEVSSDAAASRRAEERLALWRLFVAAFCAMQVMMLATPSYVADAGTLSADLEQLLNRSAWMLTLPVLLFSAAPFFASAWRTQPSESPDLLRGCRTFSANLPPS